ncbi:MAG: GNAT family N-acetyltransferase [Chitinophagaceae bacterium]
MVPPYIATNNDIVIATPRLFLRKWRTTDVSIYIEMNQNKEVMQFFPGFYTKEETMQQLQRTQETMQTHGYGLYALERRDTGEFIGFTGFAHPRFQSHFTPCVEIGWRIHQQHWQLGFATEAAKACLQYGFNELGFSTVYSFTSIHNLPSERVMQKIGMQKQGFFNHPFLADGHKLQLHVLYKISK